MYLTGYLLWRRSKSLPEEEKNLEYVYPVFLIAGNFFSMWVTVAEVINYRPASHEAWPFIFPVILAGMIALYHVVWRRLPRIFDYVLIVINVVFYIIIAGVGIAKVGYLLPFPEIVILNYSSKNPSIF